MRERSLTEDLEESATVGGLGRHADQGRLLVLIIYELSKARRVT